MIHIDMSKLNPLEQQIYDKLQAASKTNADIKIKQAAELCDCSISKISKFVQKLGFENYKQYADFLYGKEAPPPKKASSELVRISKFIEDFDFSLVDEFIELMNHHDKIVLFGYGPSYIIAQYFEYKLRIFTNKFIIAVSDEISVENIVDDTTLLVIFTATGTFRSFETLYALAKGKGTEVLMVVEEYNTALFQNCDRIFWLSKLPQSGELKPHEKTRTVFFIFIEEIVSRLCEMAKEVKG